MIFCYLNSYHRADAPIIGYLLEFSSDMEHRTGYDGSGHALGSVNDGLPKPQRLTWELSEEVGNFQGEICASMHD